MTRPRLSDPHVIEHCQCLWEHGRLTRMYHKCPIHGTDSHDRSNTMFTYTIRLNVDGGDLPNELGWLESHLRCHGDLTTGTDHILVNDPHGSHEPFATVEVRREKWCDHEHRDVREAMRGDRRVSEFLHAVFAGGGWEGPDNSSGIWDDTPGMPTMDNKLAAQVREVLKTFGITFNRAGEPIVVTDQNDAEADA